MRIESDGNVGIGTASPDEMLHIKSGTSTKPVLLLENTNADAGGPTIKLMKSTTSEGDGDELGDLAWFGMDDAGNSTGYAMIRGISADVTNGSEDGTLEFHTRVNDSSSARISIVEGKVGIETTTPDVTLQVGADLGGGGDVPSAANARGKVLICGDGDDTAVDLACQLWILDTGDGAADQGGGIAFQAEYDLDNNHVATTATIRGVRKEDADNGGSSVKGELMFSTRNAGTVAEAMRIDYLGNVGIGETAPNHRFDVLGDSAATYIAKFKNDGDNANRHGIVVQAGADDGSGTTYYFNADDGDGGNAGFLANTSGTFALTDSSDESLKENIRDTEIKGLETVSSMKVRDFEWKKSGDTCIGGFVAQELEESFSPATSVMPDGLMGVSREILVPVLVKAIQELSAKVEALENA
jgi:hypothetical protein